MTQDGSHQSPPPKSPDADPSRFKTWIGALRGANWQMVSGIGVLVLATVAVITLVVGLLKDSETFGILSSRMDAISTQINEKLDKQLSAIHENAKKLVSLEGRVGGLEEGISSLENEVAADFLRLEGTLNTDVDRLEKKIDLLNPDASNEGVPTSY